MLSKNRRIRLLLIGLLLVSISGCGSKTKNSNVINSSSASKSSVSTSEDTSSSKSSTLHSTIEQKSENKITNIVQRQYSFEEQSAITNEFINWASGRAELGGMAVNAT